MQNHFLWHRLFSSVKRLAGTLPESSFHSKLPCNVITMHKSQGLTLKYAVVNLTVYEFAAGLRYVGFSRVRRLVDLVFIRS